MKINPPELWQLRRAIAAESAKNKRPDLKKLRKGMRRAQGKKKRT